MKFPDGDPLKGFRSNLGGTKQLRFPTLQLRSQGRTCVTTEVSQET